MRAGRKKTWTAQAEELLRAIYPTASDADLLRSFPGRTLVAVKSRAVVLGVNKGMHRAWTVDEDRQLQQIFATRKSKDVARELGRSEFSVQNRATGLGLTKTPEHRLAAWQECGRNAGESCRSHRFPKGNVPANKGLRRPGWSAGRMRETQFKKGMRPHTWKPLGSLRRDDDGYLQCKVTDTGYPPRDWQAVHRLLWIEKHGPIPKGFRQHFKDGNKSNIALGNLEMLPYSESMRRNSLHVTLPPELRRVVQLTASLKAKITRRRKKAAA